MGAVIPQKPSFFQRTASRLGLTSFNTVIDPSVVVPRKPSDPITLTVSTKLSSSKWAGYTKQEAKKELAHRYELDNISKYNGPAATILDISATIGADVLMLGSSHRTKLAQLLKGNVITEVAKNLPENIQLVIHS